MHLKRSQKKETVLSEKSLPSTSSTDKLANKVFYVLVPILLGLSLLFSFYNSQKALEAAEQLKEANEHLIAISERQEADLEVIRGDVKQLRETLLCIGEFFAKPDRENLNITSYSPCVIQDTSTGESQTINLSQQAPPEASQPPAQSQNNRGNANPSSNTTPPNNPPQQENPQPNAVERTVNGIMNVINRIF